MSGLDLFPAPRVLAVSSWSPAPSPVAAGQETVAMKISLNNDLGELRTAAEQIDAFCESHDVPADITYAVNLSVDELLTNTISYGYDDDEVHGLDLALRMDGDVMVIQITDDARPFDPSRNTTPDTSAGIDERSIGGLGIFSGARADGRGSVLPERRTERRHSPETGQCRRPECRRVGPWPGSGGMTAGVCPKWSTSYPGASPGYPHFQFLNHGDSEEHRQIVIRAHWTGFAEPAGKVARPSTCIAGRHARITGSGLSSGRRSRSGGPGDDEKLESEIRKTGNP